MNSAYRFIDFLFTDFSTFLDTISYKIIIFIRNVQDDSIKTNYFTIFYDFKDGKNIR